MEQRRSLRHGQTPTSRIRITSIIVRVSALPLRVTTGPLRGSPAPETELGSCRPHTHADGILERHAAGSGHDLHGQAVDGRVDVCDRSLDSTAPERSGLDARADNLAEQGDPSGLELRDQLTYELVVRREGPGFQPQRPP